MKHCIKFFLIFGNICISSARTIIANDTRVEDACKQAMVVLGEGQVDIKPLNQSVVDENWSQSCVSEPHCIIQPMNAAAVAASVKLIDSYQVKFATRSGGHSPNPGASSINQTGILLDLQRLNTIDLDQENGVASVGPGARWGEVFADLDSSGVTVMGGRNPAIGVGGLLLGGGLFFTAPEYGMAADNVKNFEVVLSNGTMVNANSTDNDDLFWALKGGGPNFGIVTRYDLYTLPSNQIWYQATAYSTNQSADILDAFAAWQQNSTNDLKSTVGLVMGMESITVILFYSTPAEYPDIFAPFYSIQPLQVLVPAVNGTYSSLSTIVAATSSTTPLRHDYRAGASKIDAQLYKDVFDFWLEKAIAVHKATGANQTISFDHISYNVAEQGIARGGNPMNIPNQDHQWWTTLVDWEDAADDDLVRSVSIETSQRLDDISRERGLDLPFIYMDHAARDQDPLSSYGTESYGKLEEVAKKYDPNGVFQALQNGGFLLSDAQLAS